MDEVSTSWLDVMAAREYKDLIGDWIEENTDYPSVTTNTEDGKMGKILGYGMTRGLIEFNNAPENRDRQIQFINELDIYRTDCPDIPGTSGWFIPSVRELELLCSGESNGRPDWVPGMNKRIIESKLRGTCATAVSAFCTGVVSNSMARRPCCMVFRSLGTTATANHSIAKPVLYLHFKSL